MNQFQTPYVAMNPSHCTGCWKCIQNCPKHAIGRVGFLWHKHAAFCQAEECIGCRKCIRVCPNGVFISSEPEAPAHGHWSKARLMRSISFLLPVLLLATFITGIGLHMAGHGVDHQAWHRWTLAHVAFSTVCFISVVHHIHLHFRMLKPAHPHTVSTIRRAFTVSAALTFILTAVTGIILLALVDGEGSHTGLRHYGMGIAMTLLCAVHGWKKPGGK